jgi:serine protease Do
LNPNDAARYGSLEVNPGFQDDPKSEEVVAGGPIDVSYLGNECTGFAEPNPDYEIHYNAGAQPMLRIYFVANTPGDDATLIINDADGHWHCSDDEYGTTDPSIDFSPPPDGWYDIWIGSYSPSDYISGTLYVTELDFYHP